MMSNEPPIEIQETSDFGAFVCPPDKYREAYSYQSINEHCVDSSEIIECKDYSAYCDPTSKEFVYLKSQNKSLTVLGRTTGVKLHVSIRDDGSDNLEKGWNIVKNILIENTVYQFKVIKDKCRKMLMDKKSQRGKAITIYAFKDKNKSMLDWKILLDAITTELVNNNILPGALPDSDTPIKGSSYFSYKNDAAMTIKKDSKDSDDRVQHSGSDSNDNKIDDNSLESSTSNKFIMKMIDHKKESPPSPKHGYVNYDIEFDNTSESSDDKSDNSNDDLFAGISISIQGQPPRELLLTSSSESSDENTDRKDNRSNNSNEGQERLSLIPQRLFLPASPTSNISNESSVSGEVELTCPWLSCCVIM